VHTPAYGPSAPRSAIPCPHLRAPTIADEFADQAIQDGSRGFGEPSSPNLIKRLIISTQPLDMTIVLWHKLYTLITWLSWTGNSDIPHWQMCN
jgi:hypothetical protein